MAFGAITNASGASAIPQEFSELALRTAVPCPKSGFTFQAQTSLSNADFPRMGVWTEGTL